jgi:hypothetical protein
MVVIAVAALLAAGSLTGYLIHRDGWGSAHSASTTPICNWRSPPSLVRLLTLVSVVVVPVVSVGYFTSTSGFYWDDLVNFRQAQTQGLSLAYLLQPTSAHFAPGHRLGDWLLQEFFPMNFGVAQALMLAGFAAVLVMFHRLLAQLFGPGPGPLLLTLVFGASTVHVGTLHWWASGLDRLPATLLTFVSLLGYLRFFRTGSRRSLALSVTALVFSLLFYVKPALVPLYLVLMRVLLLEPRRSVRESLHAATREWRIWLLYLIPVAVFAVLYVRNYSTAQDPSLTLLARYLSFSWFQVVVPGFFGVYIPKSTPPGVAVIVSMGLQAVLVAFVIWSVRRVAGAWRAWAFFAITFLVNAALVGLTRVGLFGPKFIAYLLYYHLEAIYLFCITLGAVLLSVRVREPQRPMTSRPPQWLRHGRRVLAIGMTTYLALSWWGASRVRQEYTWFGAPARQYMETVDDGLRQIRQGSQPLRLVDGTVPYQVAPPPYNSQSDILPLLDEGLSFDAISTDLFEVGGDGTVSPVTFRAEAGGDAATLLHGGSLGLLRVARTSETESALCVAARDQETAFIVLPLTTPLEGDRWHLALDLTSGGDGALALIAERVDGGRNPDPRVVRLSERPQRVRHLFPVDETSLQRLVLVLGEGTDICIGTLQVGRLLPR